MPFRLETRLWLPAPIDRVFAFFADASSVETISPSFLRFRLLTPGVEMRRGAMLDYRLRLHGVVPLRWCTEITAWEAPSRFRNEQRRGPYRYGGIRTCSAPSVTARSWRMAWITTCPAATRCTNCWSGPR